MGSDLIGNDNEDESNGFENITNIDRVIQLFNKFIEIIEEETDNLKLMKIDKIKELHETKLKLMKWLNIFEHYVSSNRDWIDVQDDEKLANLRAIYRVFDAKVQVNHDEFKKAIVVNEFVLNWLHKEFKEANQNLVYNKDAKTSFGTFLATNSNDNVSITIDEKA